MCNWIPNSCCCVLTEDFVQIALTLIEQNQAKLLQENFASMANYLTEADLKQIEIKLRKKGGKMNKINISKFRWKIIAGCVMLVLAGTVSAGFAAEDKWDRAGQEIKEASHAVSEATEESAQKAMLEAQEALKGPWVKAKWGSAQGDEEREDLVRGRSVVRAQVPRVVAELHSALVDALVLGRLAA